MKGNERKIDFGAWMNKLVPIKGKAHQCQHCDYQSSESRNMRRHVDTIHSGLKPYLCEDCGFKTGRPENLKQHKKAFHSEGSTRTKLGRVPKPKEVKVYKCKFCEKTFNDLTNIKRHETNVHLNIKRFKCTHCDYRAKINDYLKNHMKKAHGIVVEKYAYQKAMKKKGASKKEDETAKPEEAPS